MGAYLAGATLLLIRVIEALRVRAELDGDEYRVSGQKCWQSYAQDMDYLWVLARSDTQESRGRGLSLFISERSEKVWVRHLENKLGIHGSPTCELVYEDTPARLIGERQRGLMFREQMDDAHGMLFLFPAETFTVFPFAPTLEGQYIIKNLLIISAALTIGGTVRRAEHDSPS